MIVETSHEKRSARLLNNKEFKYILQKYDHEVLPMIGIPSGWEEAAACCESIDWLEIQLFHPEFNSPDQFYCDDVVYNWKVIE